MHPPVNPYYYGTLHKKFFLEKILIENLKGKNFKIHYDQFKGK